MNIPPIETADKSAIREQQLEALKKTLRYVSARSPYYQRLFKEHGLELDDIQSLDDLSRIPTTDKSMLQEFNADFLCVAPEAVADYVTTSGTTGSPVTVALSKSDLDRLSHNEALSLACAGIEAHDTVQLMCTMDRRFMAGLAYYLGLQQIGAAVIRVGSGIPQLQWDTIIKFKPKYLIAVPSFLLKLIAHAHQHGIDVDASSVKAVICIGEPVRDRDFKPNSLAQRILRDWDIALYSTYASTEMSTAFTECEAQQGGHHHPELLVAEVLDDHGDPVAEGAIGELTITTLGVEAMPLVRFRTGDLVARHEAPCTCGRTTMRLSPVLGRKDQMIKYKGTTLYPPSLDEALAGFDEIEGSVLVIDRDELGQDDIELLVHSRENDPLMIERLKDHIRARLRVVPRITWIDAERLMSLRNSKNGRKPVSVIDKR